MNKIIHAAVRRDLARFGVALDRFVPGDRTHAEGLADMFRRFDHELSSHHHHEDEIIWPLLDGRAGDPVLLAEMESEHHALAAALAATREQLGRLAGSASAADASAARSAVAELERVTTVHLEHEERALDPLLEQVDQARWDAAQQQIRKSRPFGDLPWMLHWLSDAAQPHHAAHLRGMLPRPLAALVDRLGRSTYRRATAAAWDGSASYARRARTTSTRR